MQFGDIFVSGSGTQPWTVQSEGCTKPGSHVVLPLSSILDDEKDSSKSHDKVNIGSKLASNLLRLRYGIFSDLDSPFHVTGEQYTHCHGRTASQVGLSSICPFLLQLVEHDLHSRLCSPTLTSEDQAPSLATSAPPFSQ